MKKVSGPQVVTAAEALESPLPPQIQEALGELIGAARDGLLALSVGVGLSVVHELMEAEVEDVVGPGGRHIPDRTADDERELPVKTYGYFADRDPLTCVVMNRMLAGVSTRGYASVGEPSARTSSGSRARRRRAPSRSCSSIAPEPRWAS